MTLFSLSKSRNSRNLLTPSRVRRRSIAESLDRKWRELRVRATIETDPAKLSQLRAELEKSKRLAETRNIIGTDSRRP
jgi:hypothetical protein